MGAVLPFDLPLVHKLHVGLVNERRWLQCVVRPLATKIAACEPAQLSIDVRQYLIYNILVAVGQFDQHQGNVICGL
jgi:hypothetical protein